ncbi:MAG: ImmA/IrrE family metallo-endopeptidase [Verrucomicrobiaceae bacterium]|nr:ImmA/IrrE family metallo-endopeptidase [Verrucomicrobiaceae bacterium]
MPRVQIQPQLINWACERSGLEMSVLTSRFPRLEEWKSGQLQPTLKQVEDLARATLTPIGWLFLPKPPTEPLPVPDFRTVGDRPVKRPSAALLETIYAMQRRQEWLRDHLVEDGEEPVPFVGSVTLSTSPTHAATVIRETLGIVDGWAEEHSTWEGALLGLRRASEAVGIIVVINGIVGNNTHQALDPAEFRGFVLCDSYAPLIFINGADAKSAQMFTLAHEIAHLWLGKDGVFNLPNLQASSDAVETFCNRVAAEVLIPSVELLRCWPEEKSKAEPFQALARRFKVSPLVAARRVLDSGLIERAVFLRFLKEYEEDERRKAAKKSSGGDFYKTQETRIGRRFGLAVIRAAREGRLLYRDAYRLTGLSAKTFDQYAEGLGIKAS